MPAQYRLFVRAPIIAMTVLFALMGIFAKRGLLDLIRMRTQNKAVSERISLLKLQGSLMEEQMESFQKNPEEQERVVRQILGYIKPNETVIEFP